MPTFFITIMPLRTQAGCAGEVSARLKAYIEERPHIIPTGCLVRADDRDLGSWLRRRAQQTVSDLTIDAAKQIMKKLVNDWAASQ
jgi:hypothetical protein